MTYSEMSKRLRELLERKSLTDAETQEVDNLADAMDHILEQQAIR